MRPGSLALALIGVALSLCAVASGGRRPVGQLVAVSRGSIVVVDIPSGHARILARGSQPTWSPDGKRVVFVAAGTAGRGDLFVVRADGKQLRRLTDDPQTEHEAAWSPDGSKLAYLRQEISSDPSGPPPRDDVMVLDLTTGQTRQVTHDPYNKTTLSWSPDGLTVAYEAHSHVRTSGRVVAVLSGDAVDVWLDGSYPFWSPDGASVAFVKDDREQLSLVVARPDGSGAQVLFRGARDIGLGGVAWSPDGASIAFSYGGWSVEWTQLERVDVRTGRLREVTHARVACHGQWHEVPDTCRVDRYIDYGPSWSHDGSWIAFVRWDRRRKAHNPSIAIVDRNGRGARTLRLPGVQFGDAPPMWRPVPSS